MRATYRRWISIPAALIAGVGLALPPAVGGQENDAPDLGREVSGSYGPEAKMSDAGRAAGPRLAQREKRERTTTPVRRGQDPWGPFPGPPGLFF